MAAFIQKFFKSRKITPASSSAQSAEQKDTLEAKEARQDEQRNHQLSQLNSSPSEDLLEQLAIQGLTTEIRQEAAANLDDRERLQRVQKLAKGKDKSVYQAVRQKLQQLKEQEEQERKREETIQSLIRNATDQARSEDMKLYEARLQATLAQWNEVESHATADQVTRFLEAVHQCRERLKEQQARHDEELRQQEQQNQRRETLAVLKVTLDELKNHASGELPSLSSLDAMQKTQENRWLEATRDTQVSKEDQKSYEALMQSLRSCIAAVTRVGQHREEITELQTEADEESGQAEQSRKARELLTKIDWPASFPRPALLDPILALAGRPKAPQPEKSSEKEQKQLAETLRTTLGKLEAALEAKQLTESRQCFKTAQQQLKALDQRHSKPFQQKMQLLGGQLRELNDWQGFATEPKQVALCEQMEYLANQPMEPEAKAERIKELQNEWRMLGGSSDRALWTRFKQASDEAYEPCKAYFSAKSGLKQVNLEKRKAICAELQAFAESADWTTIDWKAAERIHQTARDEWKAAWPIEFRENRAVQKQFDELLKALEEQLNTERKKNEALKQQIVERAQALIDHEPLSEAMDQAKALQTEWKQVGITRHREDRKLWKAFRHACDEIFARRDAKRTEHERASREADEKAMQQLANSEQLDSHADIRQIREALDALAPLTDLPLSVAVKTRYNEEKSRLSKLMKTRKLADKLGHWQEWVLSRATGNLETEELPSSWRALADSIGTMEADELVIRAEILAGLSSPDAEQGRRMEIQVQRLAEGLGNTTAGSDLPEQLEALAAHWCLELPPENLNGELAQRLNKALDTLTA